MRKFFITAIFALGILGACQYGGGEDEGATPPVRVEPASASVKPVFADPENFNETDQKACIDFGGNYTRAGLLGYYNCFVDYADGGKTCSDPGDCQGRCIATNATGFDPDAPGGQTGACQKTDSPFGCYSEIVGGVAQPGLCVD